MKYEDIITGQLGEYFSTVKGYASHIPLVQLLAGLVLVFVLIYLITRKLQSLLVIATLEIIAYINIKANMAELTDQTVEVGGFLGKFHLFAYMNKVLSIMTTIPSSPEKLDVTMPIFVSIALIFFYYIYIFHDAMDKKDKGEYAPVMAVLLTLATFGGGSGIVRYLKTIHIGQLGNVSLLHVSVIIIVMYTVAVYYYDFWQPSRGRARQSRWNRELDIRKRGDKNREKEREYGRG